MRSYRNIAVEYSETNYSITAVVRIETTNGANVKTFKAYYRPTPQQQRAGEQLDEMDTSHPRWKYRHHKMTTRSEAYVLLRQSVEHCCELFGIK